MTDSLEAAIDKFGADALDAIDDYKAKLAEAVDTIARLRERVAELEAAPVGHLPKKLRDQAALLRAMDEIANSSGTKQTSEPTAKLLDRASDEIMKLAWQVRDTCTRAEKAEAELSSLKAAGTRADGIEAAAAAVQQAITELGPGLSQYDRGQFDGLRTARSRIRALSPAPEAKPVAAIEALRSHQIQLDQDGIQVGVSRQALEEVLSFAERKL